MRYADPVFESEAATRRLAADGPADQVASALIAASLYAPDPAWVEALCLEVARRFDDPPPHTATGAALLGLAHLARRFRQLDDPAAAWSVLEALEQELTLDWRTADVRDDLERFLPS